MTKEELQLLSSKYLNGETTPEEESRLHDWYGKEGQDRETIVLEASSKRRSEEHVRHRLFKNIQVNIASLDNQKSLSYKIQRNWVSYAAAVLLVISAAGIYFASGEKAQTKIHYTSVLKNDVGPGGNNAVLELGDKTKINLDEVKVGTTADLDGIMVSKSKNGSVSLKISGQDETSVKEYHTIRTPKGGQYLIELPDGSKVWLNASSSIKFSGDYAGSVREVEMEGEAYFEIAKLKNEKGQRVPFFVYSKEQRIEVLGTHFNVNSYDNEEAVKTSLLEGSVRVASTDSKLISVLRPGQESKIRDGRLDIGFVNTESAIAWKNGDFIFENESLPSIMRKMERWYDIEVIYTQDLENFKFSGAVSRSKNLSAVIKIMELTGKIKFKIEGRRVYVMT